MANYNLLKKAVADIVKKNGRQEITGENLQSTLFGVIDSLGKYATYAGIAQPKTDPKNPDERVFYFAVEKGIYTNFSSLDIPEGLSVIYSASYGWGTDVLFTFDKVATKDDIAAAVAKIDRQLTAYLKKTDAEYKYLTIDNARITYATKEESEQGDLDVLSQVNDEVAALADEDARISAEVSRVEAKADGYDKTSKERDTNLENLLQAEGERVDIQIRRLDAKDTEQQRQIDALVSRSDVVDVVKDKAALNNYDISSITINDVIKVLRDESRNNEITYYRLVSTSPVEWRFIGSLGEVYTKEEADSVFLKQVDAARDYLGKADAARKYLTPSQADKKYMERDAVSIAEVINEDLTEKSSDDGELVYNEKSGKLAAKVGGKYYLSSRLVEMSGEYPQIGRIYKTADRVFIGTFHALNELNKSTITSY